MINEMLLFGLKPFVPMLKKELKKGVVEDLLSVIKEDAEKKHALYKNESFDFIISKEGDFWFFSTIVLSDSGKIEIIESCPIDKVVDMLIEKI